MTMHNVHAVYDGVFNSASGRKMNIKNPDPRTICGNDIAAGLAKYCRFGGQINRFFSVAQHSYLVALLAPAELRKAALIHDASEAYLGDVIKPLKVILGKAYTDIEDVWMDVISVKYGVLRSELAAIKPYDKQALEIEHNAFQVGNIGEFSTFWQSHNPGDVNLWSPNYAFKRYSQEFVAAFGEEVYNA